MTKSGLKCSVVVPVYFNEGSLWPTFEKVKNTLEQHCSFEIVFVDDGSADQSLTELRDIRSKHPQLVKVIKLTRNFGQVSAIMAGYSIAQGDCIINISADLQDPPELMNQMIDEFANKGRQVVICKREAREEGLFRRATSKFFYKTMKKLNFDNMPEGGFDFVLIGKRVKELLLTHKESNRFWQGQILWTGYEPKFIAYTRNKREIGKSRWTFSKKTKYLIDGVLAYSYFPLRLMSILGIVVFIAGILYAIVITINYFFGNIPFKGWAPIMIIVLVLSGIQMLMLGVIGEYLWRTLDQVRNRADYIIETIYDESQGN